MAKEKLITLEDYRQASLELASGDSHLEDSEFFFIDTQDYQDRQFHSSCIDRILGIPVHEVEKDLREQAKSLQPGGTVESWSKAMHDGALTWVGLNPAQLQTPYCEILELLQALGLKAGDRVMDLGAGYGRMGLILGQLWPDCEFVGYEMAKERVDKGNEAYRKLSMGSASLECANIASEGFELGFADYYFIYDFGHIPHMKKLLSKLEEHADENRKFSVLARGRGINSLIQETAPWLTVETIKVENTTVYNYR